MTDPRDRLGPLIVAGHVAATGRGRDEVTC